MYLKYICNMKIENRANSNNTTRQGFTAQMTADTLQIDIFSNIDEYWGYGVSALTNQLAEAKGKPLLVRVNSFGGSVVEGYAISNLLKGYSGDVTIQIIGYACSIASIFTTAQKKVQIANDAFFMIHNPSTWGVSGTAKELESNLEALRLFETKLIDTYVDAITRRGKLKESTREDIIFAMDKETWYTAQQALEMGFVDEIIDGVDTLENKLSNNSYDFYDSYFYNSAKDFKNMPLPLRAKFDNNNNDITMTKEILAKLGLKLINETEETPPAGDGAVSDELTIESATAFLQENGHTVTKTEDLVTEADVQAAIDAAVTAKMETFKKSYVADLDKGKFSAPMSAKKPLEVEDNPFDKMANGFSKIIA